jgi:molybdopterin-biosynthesis enzyme MoeA-like protein
MAIGLIIIGDEILSGKRTDQHFPKVVQMLKQRGLQLSWAEYVGDEPARLVALLKRSFASGDIVQLRRHRRHAGRPYAPGGGRCAGLAAGAASAGQGEHPAAHHGNGRRSGRAGRLEFAGKPAPPEMAEFVQGAELIPNPYNKIAGFAVREHYFVPGFPVMAWPMIEWVLDTHYATCSTRCRTRNMRCSCMKRRNPR